MKIQFDKNHLLTIENENIPQTKEYTYNVGGYIFSDFDKGLVVLHKKDFKITNLKNLGDGMNVIYYKNNTKNGNMKFGIDLFKKAFGLFTAFDETIGKKRFFLPAQSWSRINKKLLDNFIEGKHIDLVFSQEKIGTSQGTYIEGANEFNHTKSDEESINILFGLCLLYGKFETKNNEFMSIKIQIPLFGQYLAQQETLDKIIHQLQQSGIFLKADKLTNNNGIIYQISSNDYELLEIFAKWYEPVEKFEKISKREFTDEMKDKLIEFIETNPEIPSDGKEEVLEQIKNGVIKFLMK